MAKDLPSASSGGGGLPISASSAKEILKKAVTTVLAKKASQGQSSKALIKQILDREEVKPLAAKPKDVSKELYNFYKRNPKVDTSVKTTQGTPKNPADVIAARTAARNERIRAGISPAQAKPNVTDTTKVSASGKELARIRNEAAARQAKTEAESAPAKQGQTVRGKFYEEPKPGYAGQNLPGKSISAREPNVNPEKPGINELSAFTKLTDAEKKIFWQSDKDAIQAVINATKKIKDMPKAKPPVDIDKRLFEASKKLSPAQLNKIKSIVAEVRRQAGA